MPKKINAFDFNKKDNKVNRPGIHAKTKHSNHKSSKNYRKLNKIIENYGKLFSLLKNLINLVAK